MTQCSCGILLNLLLFRNHQVEIIIAKHLIQKRKDVTRVGIQPRLCDQGRRKNDAFTLLGTLPTKKLKFGEDMFQIILYFFRIILAGCLTSYNLNSLGI